MRGEEEGGAGGEKTEGAQIEEKGGGAVAEEKVETYSVREGGKGH